jgi:hypothetical protein
MEKDKRVALEEMGGRIIVMDSAAQMGPEEAGQVVVAGSHGSEFAARYVAKHLPLGVILNDAGKGKNNAGISGLPVLDAMNILGATVDCLTARIGEGDDTYESGIISAANDRARAAGVEVGMAAAQAAKLMLMTKAAGRVAYTTPVVYDGENGRIVLADTLSYLNASHRGCVVVSGSHCAHTTYAWVKDFGLKGIFLNDAGKGKDNQGISGLPIYDHAGIPGAAVDCMTAMIGDARDAWENGCVSAANKLATEFKVIERMPVHEAAMNMVMKKH